jgi:elongation factor P--beta-lysine ligase
LEEQNFNLESVVNKVKESDFSEMMKKIDINKIKEYLPTINQETMMKIPELLSAFTKTNSSKKEVLEEFKFDGVALWNTKEETEEMDDFKNNLLSENLEEEEVDSL